MVIAYFNLLSLLGSGQPVDCKSVHYNRIKRLVILIYQDTKRAEQNNSFSKQPPLYCKNAVCKVTKIPSAQGHQTHVKNGTVIIYILLLALQKSEYSCFSKMTKVSIFCSFHGNYINHRILQYLL